MKIRFSGDMRIGKNTSQPASVALGRPWTQGCMQRAVSPRKNACIFEKNPLCEWYTNRGEKSSPHQSKIRPSVEMVTTCQGMNLPLARKAWVAACWMPPQQGTSMRTMVRAVMSLSWRMAVSFSV